MNRCQHCGKDMDLVGLSHICRMPPRAGGAGGQANVSRETKAAPKALEGVRRALARTLPPAPPVPGTVDLKVNKGVGEKVEETHDVRRIGMPASLWRRIDEHWHARGLTSRAAAVRDLIEKGLSK